MNKAFKRTKFNRYKWFTQLTVTSFSNIRVGDGISLGDVGHYIITKIVGNTVTIFDKG